jgi:sodium-dependent dicarboxylate transporter 2/3/5
MAVWWMTEAIPIPATALLPLVLFPVLGIADERAAAAPYANPLIFLFLGGFLIAIAMERWQLHRRLALNIIRILGTRPHALVAGFTVAGAFLSMWVSNTATTLMMLPIGLSVVALVRKDDDSRDTNFAINLMLVIAYSSSIGGMATLIGTPPNAFFAGFMLETYDREIGFVEWMGFALPIVLVALPLMYVVLTRLIYPITIKEIPGGRDFILEQLREIGAMKQPEISVALVFAATAVLWITRPLLQTYVPGLTDPGVAMTMALLLFLIPADVRQGQFLLDWEDAKNVPWGVLLLFGGGLSLAAAIDNTGLATWLGERMTLLADWPLLLIIVAVTGVIVLLTELTSNTATAAAFLPIAASVSVGLGYDPAMLAIPAVLAASCAFMLPVATPPNAIIYGSSFVTIPQMARAGMALNVIFTILISLATYLLLPAIVD